jgi:hypothetical protein
MRILKTVAQRFLQYEKLIAVCLFGAFATACLVLFVNAQYDDAIMLDFVQRSGALRMHGFARAVRLMHVTHALMLPRKAYFEGPYVDPTGLWFRTPSTALLTGQGGCGDFTAVLTRALQLAGEDAKTMQVRCADDSACHIITESKVDGRWVVFDPLFDVALADPHGRPLSVTEMRGHWSQLARRLPAFYHQKYNDLRRIVGTNWSKFGAASRGLYSFLKWIGFSRLDDFSVRSYVLNMYWAYFDILVVAGLPFFGLWFWRLSRRSDRAETVAFDREGVIRALPDSTVTLPVCDLAAE